MSDKHYVGQDLVSFSDKGKYKPISRVTLMIDDENCVTAGDDTGKELVSTCYNATQAMADALLAQFRGYEYQAYEVAAANLNPAAEPGDGLTADGHYVTISRMDDDGSGYPSPSAPGEAEFEDEYPSAGPMTQEFNRKIATTNARIIKTANTIRQEVTDSLNGLSASITVELESIKANVTGLNGKYTELAVTLDGVTVTDESGTTRIKGSSIETSTLYVDAAHVTGTLSAGQINMSGAITWNDLAPGVQSTINGAYNSGLSASEVKTIINSQLVLSPTIAGGKFCNLPQSTWLTIGANSSGNYGLVLTDQTDGEIFSVYNGGSGIAQFLVGKWIFLNVNSNWDTVAPMGTWDFSQANVTGLDVSGEAVFG